MSRAFSLVELSIVLVILGLLTGGILAGQSLIRAAELRAIPTEVSRFNAAVMAFRDKYFALPGDMSNATKFWNAAASCPGDHTTPATGTATCDGNGNGFISNASNWNETWRAWQHLANAGLIEGSYTGVPGSADAFLGVAGSNMPRSKAATNAGYAYAVLQNYTVDTTPYFRGNYGNTLHWGGGNGVDEAPFLKPEEAWNIDTKMDDGKPSTGAMRSYMLATRACADSNDATVAAYQLTNATPSCNLLFLTSF